MASHFKSNSKVAWCVAGGVAAGAALTLLAAHIFPRPSWCDSCGSKTQSGGCCGGKKVKTCGKGETKTEDTNAEAPMPQLKLTYFAFEGRAEMIRLAAVIGDVPFEDNRVSGEEFGKMRAAGALPNNQLPLLEINGRVTTQSLAMLRYVGRLGGLYPKCTHFQRAVDEAAETANDINATWTPCVWASVKPAALGFPDNFAKTEEGKAHIKAMRESWVANTLPNLAKALIRLLDKNAGDDGQHRFLAGGEPTIADCIALPALKRYTLGFIDYVPTTVLDAYPALKAYIARVSALPKVAAYYERVEAAKRK